MEKPAYPEDSWPKPFTPYLQRLGTRDEGVMGDRGGGGYKATPKTPMSLALVRIVTACGSPDLQQARKLHTTKCTGPERKQSRGNLNEIGGL